MKLDLASERGATAPKAPDPALPGSVPGGAATEPRRAPETPKAHAPASPGGGLGGVGEGEAKAGRGDPEAPKAPGQAQPGRVLGGVAGEAPEIDRAAFYARVKAVREGIKRHDLRTRAEAWSQISGATRRAYTGAARRVITKSGPPDLSGVSPQSWGVIVAGASWAAGQQALAMMTRQDQAQKTGDWAAAEKALAAAEKALVDLDALAAAERPAPGPKTPRAKATAIPRSAKGKGPWQQRVFDAATPIMQPAIAVMWAAGCRPAELEMGVDVFRDEKGRLCVRVRGAKVSALTGGGQPSRTLVIDPSSRAGRALVQVLGDADNMIVQRRAKRIATDFSDHIRPRLPSSWQVTAYSFRHQVSANAKADLDSPEVVAAALGQVSTRTQGNYSSARKAQAGGGAIIEATATRPVRDRRAIPSAPKKPSQKARPGS